MPCFDGFVELFNKKVIDLLPFEEVLEDKKNRHPENEFELMVVHMNMRIKLTFSFLFFLGFTSLLTSQDWKVYRSDHGKFSVMTPGLMDQKRATISTGVAALDVHTHFLNTQDSSGNFLYLINYYDLPEEMFPEDSTDFAMEFLLNTMDQSVSDNQGDLQYSNPVKIGRHQGLMWRSKSEKNVVKSRAYIINKRFYMLQVFSVPDKSLNADVDRFLDSFTLKT